MTKKPNFSRRRFIKDSSRALAFVSMPNLSLRFNEAAALLQNSQAPSMGQFFSCLANAVKAPVIALSLFPEIGMLNEKEDPHVQDGKLREIREEIQKALQGVEIASSLLDRLLESDNLHTFQHLFQLLADKSRAIAVLQRSYLPDFQDKTGKNMNYTRSKDCHDLLDEVEAGKLAFFDIDANLDCVSEFLEYFSDLPSVTFSHADYRAKVKEIRKEYDRQINREKKKAGLAQQDWDFLMNAVLQGLTPHHMQQTGTELKSTIMQEIGLALTDCLEGPLLELFEHSGSLTARAYNALAPTLRNTLQLHCSELTFPTLEKMIEGARAWQRVSQQFLGELKVQTDTQAPEHASTNRNTSDANRSKSEREPSSALEMHPHLRFIGLPADWRRRIDIEEKRKIAEGEDKDLPPTR